MFAASMGGEARAWDGASMGVRGDTSLCSVHGRACLRVLGGSASMLLKIETRFASRVEGEDQEWQVSTLPLAQCGIAPANKVDFLPNFGGRECAWASVRAVGTWVRRLGLVGGSGEV